jgi:uncharacterized protein YigE (DUF2233 family)
MHLPTALLLLLLGLIDRAAATAPKTTVVDGVAYQVVHAAPPSVRVLWQDKRGRQLRTFRSAAQYLQEEGCTTETLMNGGIFEPNGIPSGLLIQDGSELRPVNRKSGDGNFFLKPNGIFLLGTKGAAIIPTEAYPPSAMEIHYAVQSGPLLLHAGAIHPQLSKNSISRLHRNGVGVTKSGEFVLAITDPASPKLPTLHEFARLFLSLDCTDALFLDGVISQMSSGSDITKPSNSFGSIIAVTSPAQPPTPTESPETPNPGGSAIDPDRPPPVR